LLRPFYLYSYCFCGKLRARLNGPLITREVAEFSGLVFGW
jgi:hypothetical protein